MKILHTSDWHLGKKLMDRDRLQEQEQVMDEIVMLARDEQVDAVIIAGDLFDTFNPPVAAIELLYRTLFRLSDGGRRAVIAIAGNHDSPERIESPDVLARENGIFFFGYPASEAKPIRLDSGVELKTSEPGYAEFMIPGYDYPLRILYTPYANEQRLRSYLGSDDTEQAMRDLLRVRWNILSEKYLDENGVNILAAHLFIVKHGESVPEEPDDERPINIGGAGVVYTTDLPVNLDYVALGHLHRRQTVSDEVYPVVYSGSPISYSFSEADQQKYVMIAEIVPKAESKITKQLLKSGIPLKRKRFKDINEASSWLEENQDYWLELTIETDNFLKADEMRLLHDTHGGILSIIPEVRDLSAISAKSASINELKGDTDALFKAFFKFAKNGQEPNDELMDLFHEIMAQDPSNKDL